MGFPAPGLLEEWSEVAYQERDLTCLAGKHGNRMDVGGSKQIMLKVVLKDAGCRRILC